MKKLLVALLFPTVCVAQKNHDYKNLVLEGGGVRGFAMQVYLACLKKKAFYNM